MVSGNSSAAYQWTEATSPVIWAFFKKLNLALKLLNHPFAGIKFPSFTDPSPSLKLLYKITSHFLQSNL